MISFHEREWTTFSTVTHTHTSVAYDTLQCSDGNITDLKDGNVTFFPLVFHSRFDSSIHLFGVCDAILSVGKAVTSAV